MIQGQIIHFNTEPVSQEIALNNVKKEITNYIKICREKGNYHHDMALRANEWFNLMNMIGTVLNAGQALAMTAETVSGVSSDNIAITGAVFAFVNAIASRLKDSYEFNILSLKHQRVANDYFDTEKIMATILADLNRTNEYEEKWLNQNIQKFISIGQIAPNQPVRKCSLFICNEMYKKDKQESEPETVLV